MKELHTVTSTSPPPLTLTFSPCKDGTESRKEQKESLMWSRRFLSSALWWARFSACDANWKSPRAVPRDSSSCWKVGGLVVVSRWYGMCVFACILKCFVMCCVLNCVMSLLLCMCVFRSELASVCVCLLECVKSVLLCVGVF